MRAGNAPGFCYYDAAIRHDQHSVNLQVLRRKLRLPPGPSAQDEAIYPSPPMSNPPSPPRSQEEGTVLSSTTGHEQGPTTTESTTSTPMPGVTASAPIFGRPFYEPVSLPPLASAPPLPGRAQPSGYAALGSQVPQVTSSTTSLATQSLESTRPAVQRGGRKSKAHVASACVNCKRAHLSCDVNRPCTRCVASGKQDSCFDVQHKKRGRPRLREEGELKVEQMIPESTSSTAITAGGSGSSPRTLATPRRRRAESYRSLRSQGSDDSGGVVPSPTFPRPPPPTATQSTFGFQAPSAPSHIGTGFEIPTAYLDMDLTLIKANPTYRQIMLGSQEVAGQRLEEIAVAVDGESFQEIRTRLRNERTSRDPNYMPPINQPGQDPLQGAVEADVEVYTQGFQDRTYTWTQRQASPSASPFPARVRLAKANAYFVAITLPTFRPVEHIPAHARPPLFASVSQPSYVLGPQSQTPESYRSPARQLASQSAPPPTGYAPFPATHVFSAPQPSSMGLQLAPRTYPPPTNPLAPYQQHHQPQPPFPPPSQPFQQQSSSGSAAGTPRLPVAEPPTETTAFTPHTSSREPSQPQESSAALQLPPIITTPTPGHAGGQFLPALAGPSSIRPAETRSEQQDERSDSEGTIRKRRRMGIDDVLD